MIENKKMDDEKKQLKSLFKKLINDQNSIFHAADRINSTLLNKGRKSSYEKDKVFIDYLIRLKMKI